MNRFSLFSVVCLLTACGGSSTSSAPAQEPAPAAAPPAASTSDEAPTKPDDAKLTTHLKDHVKYPASRAELLAACAETPEFTGGEKQWIADHLPEGTYGSADDVLKALPQ
jgi:hypothetical protein